MAELEFKIFEESVKDCPVVILQLKGILRKITTANILQTIQAFWAQKIEFFILQMKELVLVDSSGIEFLIDLIDSKQGSQSKFFLTDLHPKIETIFRSLGVDTLFSCVENSQQALQLITQELAGLEHNFFAPPEQQTPQPLVLHPQDEEFIRQVGQIVELGKFELPLLPDMAIRISELTSNPKVQVKDIQRLIATDPSMAAQILKIANSALYGARLGINSLNNAIIRLGMRKIRSLVFAISMRATILKGEKLDIIARNLWRHSITCALLTQHLLKKISVSMDHGEVFTATLIHDIHKVVILAACRDAVKLIPQYFPRPEVLALVYRQHRIPIFKLIGQRWKLPQTIVDTILELEQPDRHTLSLMACAICFANKLTKFIEEILPSLYDLLPEMEKLGMDTEIVTEELIDYTIDLYQNVAATW